MSFSCIIFLLGICPTLSAALETLFTEEPKAAKILQSLRNKGTNQQKKGEEQKAQSESKGLQQRAEELFFVLHGKSMKDLPTEQEQINDLCSETEALPLTCNNAIKVLKTPSFQELLIRAGMAPHFFTAKFYQNHDPLPIEQQSRFAKPMIIISKALCVADYASKKLYDPNGTQPHLCLSGCHHCLQEALIFMNLVENLGFDIVMLQRGGMQFSIKEWISLTAEGQILICIPSNFLDHIHEYSAHNTWTSSSSLFMSHDLLGHILYNVFSIIIETSFTKNKQSSQKLLSKMAIDMLKSRTQETSSLLSPFVWPVPTHHLTAALCYDLLHEGDFCAPIQLRHHTQDKQLDALIFKNEGCVAPGKHIFFANVFLPFMKEYKPLQKLYLSYQEAAMEVHKEWILAKKVLASDVNTPTFPPLVIRSMGQYIRTHFDNTQNTAAMLEKIARLLTSIGTEQNVYMSLHPHIKGVVFGHFSNADRDGNIDEDTSIHIAMPCQKSLNILDYAFLHASLVQLLSSLELSDSVRMQQELAYFPNNSLASTFKFLANPARSQTQP